MAPEQATADSRLTPAVDVYALGVILYEILTGRLPFQGESPLEVLHQVVAGVRVPPRRVEPGVDRELERVCLCCLARRAEDRYASAAALADDLERWLAGRPVCCRPYRRLRALRRFATTTLPRRRRLIAGLLLAMLLAGLGWAAWVVDGVRHQAAAVERAEFALQRGQLEPTRRLVAAPPHWAGWLGSPDLQRRHERLSEILADHLFQPSPARARLTPPGVRGGAPGDPSEVWAVTTVWRWIGDGRFLGLFGSPSDEKPIQMWDGWTGTDVPLRWPNPEALGDPGWGLSVAFSGDSRTLAWGCLDFTITLWDVQTGQHLTSLEGHTGPVLCVAFSSDGRTLASGSEDQTIKLWDVKTGRQRATLKGHTAGVVSVAFSSDGRTLATESRESTRKLWDVKTGQQRTPLKWEFARQAERLNPLRFHLRLHPPPEWRRNPLRGWSQSSNGRFLHFCMPDWLWGQPVSRWAESTPRLESFRLSLPNVLGAKDSGSLVQGTYDRERKCWVRLVASDLCVYRPPAGPATGPSAALPLRGRCLSLGRPRLLSFLEERGKETAVTFRLSPDGTRLLAIWRGGHADNSAFHVWRMPGSEQR
jgi:hypothetical protein